MARTRTTVLLLVVASLALILWDLRTSDTAVRSAVQSVVIPLQRTATSVFAPLGSWARDVQSFSEPAARQQAAAPIAAGVPKGWQTAPARVVAADIAGDRAVVTVDVGRTQGVQPGNAVLATGGLIGQVSRVSDNAATVLLVTDPQSTVGVRVVPSKEMGVVSGAAMGEDMQLEVLNPAAQINTGDLVVTLGSAQRVGIPPDLPLGTITAVDTTAVDSGRAGLVAPVSGMTTLETVLILVEKP